LFGNLGVELKCNQRLYLEESHKLTVRQKQNTTKTRICHFVYLKRKREHDISKVIMKNVPSAKKAGRSMKTNTNHFMKKKTT